jgi:hypothetical protein
MTKTFGIWIWINGSLIQFCLCDYSLCLSVDSNLQFYQFIIQIAFTKWVIHKMILSLEAPDLQQFNYYSVLMVLTFFWYMPQFLETASCLTTCWKWLSWHLCTIGCDVPSWWVHIVTCLQEWLQSSGKCLLLFSEGKDLCEQVLHLQCFGSKHLQGDSTHTSGSLTSKCSSTSSSHETFNHFLLTRHHGFTCCEIHIYRMGRETLVDEYT